MQSPHGFSGGTRWGQEGGSPLGGTLLSCSPGAADEDYQQLLHCCQYCCELQAAEPWEGAQGYPQTPQPLGAHGGATQSHTPPRGPILALGGLCLLAAASSLPTQRSYLSRAVGGVGGCRMEGWGWLLVLGAAVLLGECPLLRGGGGNSCALFMRRCPPRGAELCPVLMPREEWGPLPYGPPASESSVLDGQSGSPPLNPLPLCPLFLGFYAGIEPGTSSAASPALGEVGKQHFKGL